MKKNIFIGIILIFLSIFLIIVVPYLVNELYKLNQGYITMYSASDILNYYSSLISCVITISGLLYTIVSNRNETKKQINIFKTQNHIPFFIVTSIYTLNHETYVETNTGQNLEICFYINKNDFTEKEVFINLKNVGDGVALLPKYDIDFLENNREIISKQVQKEDELEIKLNILKILNNKFNAKRKLWVNCTFQLKINFLYNNIYGIDFYQNINIEINWNNDQSKIVFKVIDISSVEIKN